MGGPSVIQLSCRKNTGSLAHLANHFVKANSNGKILDILWACHPDCTKQRTIQVVPLLAAFGTLRVEEILV